MNRAGAVFQSTPQCSLYYNNSFLLLTKEPSKSSKIAVLDYRKAQVAELVGVSSHTHTHRGKNQYRAADFSS